jgi:dCTP deaminase
MILPGQIIKRLNIIFPCAPRTRFNGVTYGLGPAGYDLRIAEDITLWPGKSIRVDTVETFNMPNDVLGILTSKSTWARLHIEHATTVIEPGWRGVLRMEINMHGGSDPITIYQGTGMAQVIFFRLEEPTSQPYEGKFQDQKPGQDAISEEG